MRNLLQQVAQPQSDSTVFVYGLIDPRNGFIRYVGKSYRPQKRFKRHLSGREVELGTVKADWIKSLAKEGIAPELCILEEVSVTHWRACEKKWIGFYRSIPEYPELTNFGDGGAGSERPVAPFPIIPKARPRVDQPLDESIKLIPLTQGRCATVDAHRFDELSRFNWTASYDKRAKTFYASRRIQVGDKSTTVLMHRVIVGDQYPHVDHKDGNGLNNTDLNLRKCSVSQNGGNRKINRNNKSGYKGVHFHKGRYQAAIRADKVSYKLGRFSDPAEAGRAYDRAAISHFGEFARTNFPRSDYK